MPTARSARCSLRYHRKAIRKSENGLGVPTRHQGVRQNPTWKKIDDKFWQKFKAVSAGNELAVKSCYEK